MNLKDYNNMQIQCIKDYFKDLCQNVDCTFWINKYGKDFHDIIDKLEKEHQEITVKKVEEILKKH